MLVDVRGIVQILFNVLINVLITLTNLGSLQSKVEFYTSAKVWDAVRLCVRVPDSVHSSSADHNSGVYSVLTSEPNSGVYAIAQLLYCIA